MALRSKDGDGWQESTFAEYAEDACRVAAGLQELGVGRGDRVVLMMRNRPEFFVADMAALLVGATPISIYNSSAPEQVQYLAGHCDAKVAILEDVGYLERFLKVRSELPALEHIVLMEDPDGVAPDDVRAWEPMLGLDPVDIEAASKVVQPVRPRHRHLHVGDHRAAEGRDARSRQHLLDRREPAAHARATSPPKAAGSCRTCRWRTSPSA